jgi:ribA/ribD-fused uncharacterized protein
MPIIQYPDILEMTGEYRFLSNFWSCFIEYKSIHYPSVENAYQAAKMKYDGDRDRFINIKASEAKRLGRIYPMRPDWDAVKVSVMKDLVRQKFKDPKLRERLLKTGWAKIEEGNYWGDTFWGTVNGEGENHLGKILMEVREEIFEELKKAEIK